MKVYYIIAKEICDYLTGNYNNEYFVTIHLCGTFFIHTKDGCEYKVEVSQSHCGKIVIYNTKNDKYDVFDWYIDDTIEELCDEIIDRLKDVK